MTRTMTKTILAIAAAVGLGMATPAAADTILFCGDGSSCVSIDSLDWAQGNTVLIESADGLTGTIAYQANLDSALFGTPGLPVYTNGDGGNYYDAVAFFTVTFVDPVNSPGIFTIDANSGQIIIQVDDAPADDLTGTGFLDGTTILQGTVNGGFGSFAFFPDLTGPCTQAQITAGFPGCTLPLDSFNTNNYPGVLTLQGTGASSLVTGVSFVNPTYFPNLQIGSSLTFTNTSLIDPYRQTDPSATFLDGALPVGPYDTCGAGTVLSGNCVNGTGNTIMTQADANTSFTAPPAAVPEPASLLLLGTGLLGFARARRSRKA